tara:strand:+ start:3951 stop:4082 length:132 start_codon:yes stop_codon:yes gene_type:complete
MNWKKINKVRPLAYISLAILEYSMPGKDEVISSNLTRPTISFF